MINKVGRDIPEELIGRHGSYIWARDTATAKPTPNVA